MVCFLKNIPLFRAWHDCITMLQAMFERQILVNFFPPVRLADIALTWLTEAWQKQIVITMIFIQSHPGHQPLWSLCPGWACHHIRVVCWWTNIFSRLTEWSISSLSPAWIMCVDMWSTSTRLALVDVLGSQVVVELVEVVYHYITMPSRAQHAMITSLHFSPPRGSQQTQNVHQVHLTSSNILWQKKEKKTWRQTFPRGRLQSVPQRESLRQDHFAWETLQLG